MKKVFGQTVRDIKREVNKKVLKVPGIEQKVLDATSNETWGPHGSLLADIAQATRNYNEYQMIMPVIWKRISDTGKNWRHVYKALTVLEYLVANGSERVIDEIREHGYQISNLADFQYIDSSGRDQGSNVRKKSQILVALVNDKERIIEVRQKAAANRDKFYSTSASGYRSSSYGTGGYGDRYDDEQYEGRYGSRDEDPNGYGYGRDREYSYKDDDHYGRYGDRYGRDCEERYSRDGYRDDDYRGRSQNADDYGSGSRTSRDQAPDDDGQSSSRDSGARLDDQYQDGRRLEQKFSEQNIGGPSSYEEAVGEFRSPACGERNGETSAASALGASTPAPRDSSQSPSNAPSQSDAAFGTSASPVGQEAQVVDEFDPRGSFPAAPTAAAASSVLTASNNTELDLIGTVSDSFTPNPLAIMAVTSTTETDNQTNTFAATQTESNVMNQHFEDPFGETPFKAVTSADCISTQQQNSTYAAHFQTNQNSEMPMKADMGNNFGQMFSGMTYSASSIHLHATDSQFLPPELSTSQQETDILADILPPSGPPVVACQAGYSAPTGQPVQPLATVYGNFSSQAGPVVPVSSNMVPQSPQFSSGNLFQQGVSATPIPSNMALQTPVGSATQFNNGDTFPQGSATTIGPQTAHNNTVGPPLQLNNGNFLPQQSSLTPVTPQMTYQAPTGLTPQYINDVPGNLFMQGQNTPFASEPAVPSSAGSPLQLNNGNSLPQQSTAVPVPPQMTCQAPTGLTTQHNNDVLGNLFMPGQNTPVASQPAVPSSAGSLTARPPLQLNNGNFLPQQSSAAPVAPQMTYQAPTGPTPQHNNDVLGNLFLQGQNTPVASQPTDPSSAGSLTAGPPLQLNNGNFLPQQSSAAPAAPQMTYQAPTGQTPQHNSDVLGNLFLQGQNTPVASQPTVPSSAGSLATLSQPSKDKFETKSAVWADTLSRGLVNLNISGPKINPLADIGIDFDAINRKEKRLEKPTTAAITSTVNMGKAMGSGSGMGRAGASTLRPPSNPMMGPGMGMGVGMGMPGGPGTGMSMGGYGGMQQPMGMGMNMGMGMGMGQGGPMQPPTGLPSMPGGYNPMMGPGGYTQQPYGSGHR